MAEHRVLVCGGRDYRDMSRVIQVLDDLDPVPTLVIHGAARGADACGWRWACMRFVPDKAFPADWKKHGRAAGPIRNQQMLDEGKPDLVVAFPSVPCGPGTADMMRRARAAGVPVIEVFCQLPSMEGVDMSDDWRPIETAPTGEPVLRFEPVVRRKSGEISLTARIVISDGNYPRKATHWMPLPTPPRNT